MAHSHTDNAADAHIDHDGHGHCHGGHCHSHNHSHDHDHGGSQEGWRGFTREIISGVLLVVCLVLEHTGAFASMGAAIGINASGFDWLPMTAYLIALLPVGWPVVVEMFRSWGAGSVMNEFTLMVVACVGAFIIGEYPEGVAVLLFYAIGEKLEDVASDDVRRRVRSLLGRIPDSATVIDNGERRKVSPKNLPVGTRIIVQPGERVPIDAKLEGNDPVDFDTAAITGESVPRSFSPGQELPSGIIPVDRPIEATTVREFDNSSMTRILKMIEDAQAGKSHTETMLRRITKWYTPAVFALALCVFFIPWIVAGVQGIAFDWQTWFRRSLVFLVCSCPCALVVSIPLSYFVSLGTASRLGLLFKGSKYLDGMDRLKNVVFDKTGTLTTGEFHVSVVKPAEGVDADTLVSLAAAIDADSTHPLARSICAYAASKGDKVPVAAGVKAVRHGVRGTVDGAEVSVGSGTLMETLGVKVPESSEPGSRICVERDGKYLGSIYLEDTVKEEAAEAIADLHRLGIKVTILSGDRKEAVERVAKQVGADAWQAEMLPEDKQKKVDTMHQQAPTAFVGDGINDAPAIAASDVGVAMGTMGTGMAMDTADVIISGDNLKYLARAVLLSRRVKLTVAENVTFALLVKAVVMILGAFGIATLWAAVFADTGVTLITILFTMLMLRKVPM